MHPIPSVVVTNQAGTDLLTLFDNNPGATFKVSFDKGEAVFAGDPQFSLQEDTVVGFSSRGPNTNHTTGEYLSVLKPDVTAPGIHVLAGASPEYVEELHGTIGRYGKQSELFQVIQGTSMSSPHVAGLGALLKALHPDWSPAEIQSALMLTGLTTNQFSREAGGDVAASAFDMGAGRVQVTNAAQAGFVLDETKANYLAADPAIGGDPATLNHASLTQAKCLNTCSWTRLISSTQSSSVNWNVNTTTTDLSSITVDPSSFTLNAGSTQMVTITVDATSLSFNDWGFGDVQFTASGQVDLHMPVVARRVPGIAPVAVEIPTRRDQGIYPIEGLKAGVTGSLDVKTFSGTPQTVQDSLDEDPSNDDPYDDLAQVFYTTVNVAAGTRGLDVQITESEAPDLDLFVGLDTNANNQPDESEELCSSTTGSFLERCSLPEPGQTLQTGTYWILVQNWGGSGAGSDQFTLEWTLLTDDGGSGPLQVSGDTSVTAGSPYNLNVSWNLPNLNPGNSRRSLVELTAASEQIGLIDVTLNRLTDDVTKFANPAGAVTPGDQLEYVIQIRPDPAALAYNGGSATYILTDTLPTGMTYVNGSASIAPTSVSGQQIVWNVPVSADAEYIMSNSADDPNCSTVFGGYVNLEDFLISAISTVSGDNVVRDVDDFYGGTGAYNFFGQDYDHLYFTSNGYVVFADSTPGGVVDANASIPTSALPNNFAAGLWRDFEIVYNETNNYGATVAGAGGGSTMYVEYDDIQAPDGSTLDMNIIVRRQPSDNDGAYEIIFAYDNVNLNSQTGTIGLENSNGTAGLQYAYDNVQNLEDLIICYDWTNQVDLTYEVQIDSGVGLSAVLTNTVEHFVNGGGEATTQAQLSFATNEYYLPIIQKND